MSLAIQWGDEIPESSGFLFFDAVTAYTQSYSGTVTKHPLDSGSNVTDHFIKDNPSFTLSVVFSSEDISLSTYLINSPDGVTPLNAHVPPSAVSINSGTSSLIQKLLPDSIGQFLSSESPNINIDGVRDSDILNIRTQLERLIYSGVKYNEKSGRFENVIQTIKLYEYNDTTLTKSIPDNSLEALVLTKVNFKEDPTTGSALYADLSFERVSFSYLQKEKIPKDVIAALNKKSSGEKKKGYQDSTPTAASPAEEGPDKFRDNYTTEINRESFKIGGKLGAESL